MIKTDQTDYAAAYRQYCTYGRGRTLKKFCEDEDYNYTVSVHFSPRLIKK